MALACFHCGEAVAAAAPLVATVAGLEHPVCCIGCRAAAEWIGALGLQDYYRLREAPPPKATATPDFAAWNRPQLHKLYVHARRDGSAEIDVLVEGLRCAACSWLIERALASMAGVREISVNVPARRARIVWEPARVELSAVLGAISQLGYVPHPLDRASLDAIAAREQRTALKRLVVAGLGMMQAMMFAVILYAGDIEGIDPATRDFYRWIGLIVTIPVVFYSARPFFAGAWRELRARHPGMDTPVALAVGLVFAASVVETLRGGAQVYFDAASMFVFLLLGGRYLEMRGRHRAADVVDALARLQPATASRRNPDGCVEVVGIHELSAGDQVLVASGAVVPADGRLLSASCRVDEAVLSGESRAVRRLRGEPLIAGSFIVQGPIDLCVERVGAQTMLSAIVRLVGQAQRQRPVWARQGDRIAGRFVFGLLLTALATAAGWLLVDPARAFAASLAVLVVACPCAFALAVPAALARAVAVMARHGVLVVSPNAIEGLVRADHFAFDKTGTLTQRRLEVDEAVALTDLPIERCLAIAAQLEQASNHPIAAAIRAAAGTSGAGKAVNALETAGSGVAGDIDGTHYRIGRVQFADSATATDSDDIVLASAQGPLARFRLREMLRPDAAMTLDALRAGGATLEILSGDGAGRVAGLAARLGVSDFAARLDAEQKLARLAGRRAQGRAVAVVGDGVNDAPALAGADLAIALGSGAELAHAHADIVLAGDRLCDLLLARRIAATTQRVMRQNLAWAIVYNAASLPLAALGWVPPWLAAIGMSLSSFAVIANSLRIRAPTASDAAQGALPPLATGVTA